MRQYQPRNQNKEIISRWDLFMALGAKYQHLGSNPFVFKIASCKTLIFAPFTIKRW